MLVMHVDLRANEAESAFSDIKVTTCHNYKIQYKFQWQCTKCKYMLSALELYILSLSLPLIYDLMMGHQLWTALKVNQVGQAPLWSV